MTKTIRRGIGTRWLKTPPTPGRSLLRELKNREAEMNKDDKDRIKFVEKGGIKIKQILNNKYTFKNIKCKEQWCPLWKGDYGNFKVACNTEKSMQTEPNLNTPNHAMPCLNQPYQTMSKHATHRINTIH